MYVYGNYHKYYDYKIIICYSNAASDWPRTSLRPKCSCLVPIYVHYKTKLQIAKLMVYKKRGLTLCEISYALSEINEIKLLNCEIT